MINVYCIHIFTHMGIENYDYQEEVDEIKELNPDKILCFSTEEVDTSYILRHLFEKIHDWLVEHNTFITVFRPPSSSIVYRGDPWRGPGPQYTNIISESNLSFNITLKKDVHDMLIANSYEDVHLNAEKLFTCYINRASNERAMLVDTLVKQNLKDHGIVTFNNICNYDWQYHDGSMLKDEENFQLHSKPEFNPFILPKSFTKGYFDIVCESRMSEGEFFVTEKTSKSLTTLKPFLVFGCKDFQKFLEDTYDIEPYTELFDYSFDSKSDYRDRINGIVDNISRLAYLSNDSVERNNIHAKILPKLLSNREKFFNSTTNKEMMMSPSLKFLENSKDYKLHGHIDMNRTLYQYTKLGWIT